MSPDCYKIPRLSWQKLETVLLDMDGTILDLHFDNYFWLEHLPKRFAKVHQLSVDQAKKQLLEKYNEKRGQLKWYCLDYWSEILLLDIVALKREVSEKISIRADATDFLRFLKEMNKNIYLITNAHPDSLQLKLEQTNIKHYFDGIYSSHRFSLPKESPEMWQSLQCLLSFDKEKTLLIDDNEAVLVSAKKFGIKHLYGVSRPDSTQQKIDHVFPAINLFSEIY